MPSVAHGISLFIARARGPAAFEYMPQLRAIQGDARDLPTFIRVASRGERAPVEALVTSAARQGDVRLAAAALQAARLDDVSISDDAVEALLRESRVLRLRTTALGHLILSGHRESELSDQLRVAARAAFGTVDDPAATVIVELARRLLGHPARNDEAWTSTFTQRAADLREVLGDLWMFNLIERLSDSEYAAVTRALYGSPRGRSEPWKTDADGNARKQAGMRLLSGHPREFATSLVEATTCRPDLERNSGGGGRVSYRPDGRVARVFVADTSTSRECARVVQALLVTSVVEPDRTVRADEEDVLVFPFQRDFVTCQDALPSGPARRDVFTNPGIKPPRQRKKPSPSYPLSAKSERVSGTVVMDAIIGTTGCIGAAAVVRSVDPRLDWEALRTVAAWTFTPTVVDGAPVAVAIVVELEFRLR
jgi:TonB family protein